MICVLSQYWIDSEKTSTELPISLHSVSDADYSANPRPHWIPEISLAIINDVIQDHEPKATDIEFRVATLQSQLRTPVPTATPRRTVQNELAIVITVEQTNQPTRGATFSSTGIATMSVAVPTIPIQIASPTSKPTTIFIPYPTNTQAVIIIKPSHTSIPTASQTPTTTPTETQTATSTQTPTSTLTLTPTPTVLSTETVTATETSTPTLSSTPTADICAPNPVTGFISSFSPVNGSIDVPVSVQPVIYFNQSMNIDSLTYGDERHIVLCTTAACRTDDIVPATILINNFLNLNDQVTVIPTGVLAPLTVYYLEIGNQIQNHEDCGTINQGLRYQISFSTAP